MKYYVNYGLTRLYIFFYYVYDSKLLTFINKYNIQYKI